MRLETQHYTPVLNKIIIRWMDLAQTIIKSFADFYRGIGKDKEKTTFKLSFR